MLNGSPIAGANGPSYTATEGGSYSVSISNAVATTVSSAVVVGSANRLVNVSTRADVQTGGGIAIAGFVIDGAAGSTKQVLIRGVGPTLSEFSLTGVLEQPTLTLFDSSNTQIDSNTVWGTNADPAAIASISASVGAFALPAGSADSVLLENLAPGQYTAELTGANATSGVGLVEVYETNTSDPDQLINISTRAFVGTGANIMIAGFVVQGTQPAQVLVRAVGPTLASFSVTGFLPNPVLTVFDSTNTAIATNTGWGNRTGAARHGHLRGRQGGRVRAPQQQRRQRPRAHAPAGNLFGAGVGCQRRIRDCAGGSLPSGAVMRPMAGGEVTREHVREAQSQRSASAFAGIARADKRAPGRAVRGAPLLQV